MTVLTQNAQTHAGAESCRPQQRANPSAGKPCAGGCWAALRTARGSVTRGSSTNAERPMQQPAAAGRGLHGNTGGAIHSGAICTATARSSHSTEQPSLGTNRRREAPRLLPAPASPRPSGSPGRRRALERPAGQSSDNGLNPQPRRAELSFFFKRTNSPAGRPDQTSAEGFSELLGRAGCPADDDGQGRHGPRGD